MCVTKKCCQSEFTGGTLGLLVLSIWSAFLRSHFLLLHFEVFFGFGMINCGFCFFEHPVFSQRKIIFFFGFVCSLGVYSYTLFTI